jgi:phage baseplate assembly protein V
MDLRGLSKLLAPLRTRIANMIARAVVQLVDDEAKLQMLQLGVLADETRDQVERVQNYGFTCVPLRGAEAVVLFVDGRRDHGLVVAVDDRRHRMAGLQPGEVAVYNHVGASVVLKADGSVEVTGTSIVLNGGTQPVARAGDTAGPYPIVGGNPTVVA